MDYHTYPGSLFDYHAGVICGVLVTEDVMRKLAKLQAQHLEAVQRLLMDNRAHVYPSMWTLHYPEGKQTEVHYIDPQRTVEQAVKHASTAIPPRRIETVFQIPPNYVGNPHRIVKDMADARALALYGQVAKDPETPRPTVKTTA